MNEKPPLRHILFSDLKFPLIIALVQLSVQILFHNNYGYFRDELYYIACSKHLAFGYVDQPPLSLFILAFVRWIAGDSLQVIRFLPSIAGAGVVIVAALMTKKLGGGRYAQGLASLSIVAAHVLLGQGRCFTMNSFDIFFWTLALYLLIRIVVEDNPKLWLWFGTVAGLGLLNKYSVGFLCIGLVVALLLTPTRRQLRTKWFWLGALISFVLFLPHVLWEFKYGFPSLEFMRNASQQKNVPTSPSDFLLGQFREVNFLNAPIWLFGLFFFFFHPEGKRFRFFSWLYVVLFAIFALGNGKAYYLSPIYPVVLAGGSVILERSWQKQSFRWMKVAYPCLMVSMTLLVLPLALPVLPIGTFIGYQKLFGFSPKSEERTSVSILPQGYADEFGWEDMVAGVAKVYQTLTPEEQTKCVIYVRNYGEAGAIDFFGKQYGLPGAICGHNNYWLWGPAEKTGDVAIILGTSRNLQENLDDLQRRYEHVEPAFTTKCSLCMPYENDRQFFLCRGMKTTFQKIWPGEKHFI